MNVYRYTVRKHSDDTATTTQIVRESMINAMPYRRTAGSSP